MTMIVMMIARIRRAISHQTQVKSTGAPSTGRGVSDGVGLDDGLDDGDGVDVGVALGVGVGVGVGSVKLEKVECGLRGVPGVEPPPEVAIGKTNSGS
jgi:hypothetical protein